MLSNTTPINWTHVASTAQIQANTTVTVSPAFSPTVISTTQTPSLLSSSTPLFATRIPLSTSAVAATMPSSNPGVTTVGLPGYKSNFYTDITITSAIRSLLVGNRQIQEKFLLREKNNSLPCKTVSVFRRIPFAWNMFARLESLSQEVFAL